jgi:uncharacterized protein (TIGR00251 family)
MAECMFSVRLTPRASQDKIIGWEGDVLRVRVTAPPVEGRANEALLRLLARALDVPTSRLRLVRGQTQRNKVVAVEGLTADEVRERLE